MKKSMDESTKESETPEAEKAQNSVQDELLVDVFFSEGGFSLLIIFPMTVLYFLSMALSSI
jgi:hypothetical protein